LEAAAEEVEAVEEVEAIGEKLSSSALLLFMAKIHF
jgi:hypothetical protein